MSINSKAVALVLDKKGTIQEIRHNTITGIPFKKGQTLLNYLEGTSITRFMDFLEETRKYQYSFGGEVAFIHHDTYIKVSLVMMQFGDNIICMSLNEDEHTVNILNEIIRINIDQNNQLRKAYTMNTQGTHRDPSLEKMSLLNSELVNTQRELAKKNSELERLNQKLKEIGEIDYLTNIPNRRKFFEDVHAIPYNTPYRMIMIDFNNFKLVNDQLGHDTGDETLIKFTQHIKEMIKSYEGRIYRIGGDEFIVLVQKTQSFNLHKCVDSINKVLRNIHPKLSIAYGVVTIKRSKETPYIDIEQELNRADKLMYKNKYTKKAEDHE